MESWTLRIDSALALLPGDQKRLQLIVNTNTIQITLSEQSERWESIVLQSSRNTGNTRKKTNLRERESNTNHETTGNQKNSNY